MSATLKHAPATTGTTDSGTATPLLDDIVARVSVIEAKQGRPSPVHLRTWEEIERFAEKAARSGMVPKDFIGKPDAICIAIQMGSELGLAPMQALQNIAVVNGRPSLWGDALPALCRASGLVSYIREWSEGEGDDLTFYCETKRKDQAEPIIGKFSVSDAKRAGLWKTDPKTKKQGRDGPYEVDSGPWYSYTKRMLQMRSRGFCLRDAYPDVLKGLITAEEAADIPFEETGLVPRLPERRADTGRHIGDALPEHSGGPKRTLADVIQELESEFVNAGTRDEVDAVLASEKCQRTLDYARNGAKERLDAIIKIALDRTATLEGEVVENAPENQTSLDDGWPGPDVPRGKRAA